MPSAAAKETELMDMGSARVPVPDPTELTSRALHREIAALKEIFEARLTSQQKLYETTIAHLMTDTDLIRSVIQTRLDGMDKAILIVQHRSDILPDLVDEKIASLQAVHEEKFKSIATQFIERDTRTEQTSRDSKVAVDAALQAAKEAVAEQNRSSALAIAKSEASTVKQIDQQAVLIQTTAKASDDKIDDIKIRLTRIEGRGEGETGAVTNRQSSIGVTLVVIGLVVTGLLGLAEVLVLAFHK